MGSTPCELVGEGGSGPLHQGHKGPLPCSDSSSMAPKTPGKTKKLAAEEPLERPSSFDGLRDQYRARLHLTEKAKRVKKAAKARLAEAELDLQAAVENRPMSPDAVKECGVQVVKRLAQHEQADRDLKRVRASLKNASESYLAFEDEDPSLEA